MNYLPMLLIACAYALVSGCATQRPNLSDSEAREVVVAAKVIHGCSQQGYLTAEDTATGQLMLTNRMNQFTVDRDALIQMGNSMPVTISTSVCRDAEIAIAKYRQISAINRQNAQATPQYNNALPKRTVCNNIAGQILCSTY